MSDIQYQIFQHYGTNAERIAFTPDPAVGIQPIYIWYETDTGDTYLYDTTWHLLSAAGGGLLSMFAVSNTTQSTSGTANLSALSFAGAGIASVGITNGSVIVSVPSGGGGLTNINVSAGTTSQNLSNVVFSNSNNLSFGLSGSTVTGSATVASTQGSIRISAGTTSVLSSAFTFSNSNNLSFGINNGTITGSATVASTQGSIRLSAGTTSNLSSNFIFSNSNNISFGLDGNTLTATATVASTQGSVRISAGTTSILSSGFTFSDSNNVSFGINTNGVVTATATMSGGGSVNISAGTTSNNLTALTFSNANGVSFGLDGSTITATVQTNYLTTAMASNRGSDFVQATATIAGTNISGTIASNVISLSVAAPGAAAINFSAGTTSNNLTQVVFSNSNNVSFGLDGSTVTASATVASTQASISFSAGTTSNNSSGFTLSNSNNVSFGLNAGVFTATATVASTQASISFSAGTTSNNSSGFTFSNSNNVSFGLNAGVFTATATVATSLSNIRVSAGTTSNLLSAITFSNSNNVSFGIDASTITASVTVASTQASISFSGGTTSNLSSGFTLSNSNNVSFGLNAGVFTATATVASTQASISFSGGTTSNLSSGFTLSNSNNVSFGLNAGVFTATATFNQTNQTLGLYMSSNTTSSVSSGTVDARSMTFRGVGVASVGYSGGEVIISVPAGGGGITAVNISAGTTSNNLSALTFADSNGISFGIDASTITGSVNTYSTVGTATTGYSVASANSVGTVTRWAAEDHRHAGVGGIGISTSGNTAGTTGSVLGTYWIQGGNSITVSQITSNNGSHTLVLSGPTIASSLTNIKVSAGTVSNLLSDITFSNSNGVSFGLTASTLTASVVTAGIASMWPYPLPGSTAVSTYYSGSTSQGAGGNSTRTGYTFSLYAVPMVLPAPVAFSELRIGISNQSVAATGSATHMYSVGIYTNNASTLSALHKFYGGIVISQNSVTAQTFSVFTATTAGVTSGAGGGMAGISKHSVYSSQGNISANSQLFGRLQFIRIDSGVATTLSDGQYWMVFGNATASSSANVLSQVGVLQSNAIQSINIPDLGRENNTQTSNYLPVWGAISTTFSSNSNAAEFFPLPNAIAFTDMSRSSSDWLRFHFPVIRNLS